MTFTKGARQFVVQEALLQKEKNKKNDQRLEYTTIRVDIKNQLAQAA
jgi:hypothetical protein